MALYSQVPILQESACQNFGVSWCTASGAVPYMHYRNAWPPPSEVPDSSKRMEMGGGSSNMESADEESISQRYR